MLHDARQLGREVINRSSARAGLALSAARAVVAGDKAPEDAEQIYLAYYDAVAKPQQRPATHPSATKCRCPSYGRS
jgi:hypothetical protein